MEDKNLQRYAAYNRRVEESRAYVMPKAKEIAEAIVSGYSPSYACKKIGFFNWNDFRELLLEDRDLADAWALHLNRMHEKSKGRYHWGKKGSA